MTVSTIRRRRGCCSCSCSLSLQTAPHVVRLILPGFILRLLLTPSPRRRLLFSFCPQKKEKRKFLLVGSMVVRLSSFHSLFSLRLVSLLLLSGFTPAREPFFRVSDSSEKSSRLRFRGTRGESNIIPTHTPTRVLC